MNKQAAILVAAGAGRRAGGQLPKQFVRLGGRPILRWSAQALVEHALIDPVLVMVDESRLEMAAQSLEGLESKVQILPGGRHRAETVRLAVEHLLADKHDIPESVLIHDAVRPGLSASLIDRLLVALEPCDGVAPALAIADSMVRQTEKDGPIHTIDRAGLYRVQTPQVFRLAALKSAMQASPDNGGETSTYLDEMSLVRDAGFQTRLIDGDERLAKITWEKDFAMLEHLLDSDTSYDRAPRIGTGFDVHAFAPDGDRVILCGVSIPHDCALQGHSDADVAFHALTDAILGALAEGDIGSHFPPTQPEWKDAPSSLFLTHACELARQRGYEIGNVDLTLICEAPSIAPHRNAMRTNSARVLQCSVEQVSVKATTTEKLGAMGRGEGIAAQSVVSLVRHHAARDHA